MSTLIHFQSPALSGAEVSRCRVGQSLDRHPRTSRQVIAGTADHRSQRPDLDGSLDGCSGVGIEPATFPPPGNVTDRVPDPPDDVSLVQALPFPRVLQRVQCLGITASAGL